MHIHIHYTPHIMIAWGPGQFGHNVSMVAITEAAVTTPRLIQLGTKWQTTLNLFISHSILINVSRSISFQLKKKELHSSVNCHVVVLFSWHM